MIGKIFGLEKNYIIAEGEFREGEGEEEENEEEEEENQVSKVSKNLKFQCLQRAIRTCEYGIACSFPRSYITKLACLIVILVCCFNLLSSLFDTFRKKLVLRKFSESSPKCKM